VRAGPAQDPLGQDHATGARALGRAHAHRPRGAELSPLASPSASAPAVRVQILRKIACDESDALGDTSTLADPAIVQILIDKVAQAKDSSAQVKQPPPVRHGLSGLGRFLQL